MDTKVVYLYEQNLDEETLIECGRIVREGGLVVFPTETVYGLGANALDGEAVKKIFKAKGRPQDNPLIVHIADVGSIKPLVKEIPEIAKSLMEKFWPGPLTIILKKSELIPLETSAGLDSVGIRMPSNIIAAKLIEESKVPIAAPSANISGRPSPTDMERCIEDLFGKVDYIIGGEKCDFGLESTVVDCTEYPPCVLRPGGVTLEMLQEIDENIYIDPAILKKIDETFKPKAPGMKYRHYAPKAPLYIIQGQRDKVVEKINSMVEEYKKENKMIGVIATEETKDLYKDALVISLGSIKDMKTLGKNLFETLRVFDDKGVHEIFSECFEEKGIGIAIMNRLKKSSGYNIINV
ncbi:L-threonylcarbamoyladenylate synthase [Clostridium malenominatum]|uniref:Threonylcarbamoyl-AMP synthase n=1 Tax=Clostridium malenominatum TaxID=1539 RepID=A0ABN1J4L8_9CLOT